MTEQTTTLGTLQGLPRQELERRFLALEQAAQRADAAWARADRDRRVAEADRDLAFRSRDRVISERAELERTYWGARLIGALRIASMIAELEMAEKAGKKWMADLEAAQIERARAERAESRWRGLRDALE